MISSSFLKIICIVASLLCISSCAGPGRQEARTEAASWSEGGSKTSRCAALVRWYEATLTIAGPDAFSPHIHIDRLQKITARGFVDDVFAPRIGMPYSTLTSSQRKSLSADVGSCELGPVDPLMRQYIQAAFSNNPRTSTERDWPAAITAAQRIESDRATFRGGKSFAAAATASLPDTFVPYAQATTKAQRCQALQQWYERGITLGGPNTFGKMGISSNDVMASFARAFAEDLFMIYFGVKYEDILRTHGAQTQEDVVTCDTPAVGQWAKVMAVAFHGNQKTRASWTKVIDAERAKLARMRWDAIPVRAQLAEVAPPPDKAPGRFDAGNRNYSRLVYSNDRVTVGVRDRVSRKCVESVSYSVGIDLGRDEPITPTLAQGVLDKVLVPLAQQECPGTDLIIFATFYHQTLSVTPNGEVVPAGSTQLTEEVELATATYGPGHRTEKQAPEMAYGGINRNWPELARLDGIVDYAKRGNRDPAMVKLYSRPHTVQYVNYQPSIIPSYLEHVTHGRLIHQIASHDFFSIYRDGFEPDLLPPGLISVGKLFSAMTGGKDLNPLTDITTPRKRGFVWAINAYSENCRHSLGNNPAVYRLGAYDFVGETETQGLVGKIVTKHYEWKWHEPVYMDSAYYDTYVEMYHTEIAILEREIVRLRDELGLEELLIGDAVRRPIEVALEMKANAAAHFQHEGCDRGKQLLRNWEEFIHGPEPPIRIDERYPMVIERLENDPEEIVSYGDVPDTVAPSFPYTEGRLLSVDYYGNRRDGLRGYMAGPFNLAFLGRDATNALLKKESAEILKTFKIDRIRILNCHYRQGTANYWLEGFPKPNDQQRSVAGPSFRGTASRCPARWPG